MTDSKINIKKYKTYNFGSHFNLSDSSFDILIDCFNDISSKKASTLEGRCPVKFVFIPEVDSIVAVKTYQRGGIIAALLKDRYLNFGSTRSQKEFEFLKFAKKANINVPIPLAFAYRGYPFYRTWLVTYEIKNHTSFAGLCFNDKQKALSLLPVISENIKRLIDFSIHHVDLHPGNILIDENNKNYIIDFDKAYFFAKSRGILEKKYKKRWNRAVQKYSLPNELIDFQLF